MWPCAVPAVFGPCSATQAGACSTGRCSRDRRSSGEQLHHAHGFLSPENISQRRHRDWNECLGNRRDDPVGMTSSGIQYSAVEGLRQRKPVLWLTGFLFTRVFRGRHFHPCLRRIITTFTSLQSDNRYCTSILQGVL